MNDTWICDAGRMSYKEIESADRIRESMVRDDGGALASAGLGQAIEEAAARLRRAVEAKGAGVIAGFASPHATNENLFALKRFCSRRSGPSWPTWRCPAGRVRLLILRKDEGRGQRQGARALGFEDPAGLVERIRGGGVDGLLILGHDLLGAGYLAGTRGAAAGRHARLDRHAPAPSPRATWRTWCSRRATPPRSSAPSPTTPAACSASSAAVEPALGGASRRRDRSRAWARALGLEGFDGDFDPHVASRALSQAVPAFAGIDVEFLGDDGARPRERRVAADVLEVILKTVFILAVVVGAFAPVITWVERKQSAVMQDRIGANRADVAGITLLGLLHPLADVIKLLTKEDVVPDGANRVMHLIAPVIAAVPAIVAFAVIPYGGVYQFERLTELSLVVADIDWGLLYLFATARSPPTARSWPAGRATTTGRCSAACATRRR